VEYEYGYGYGYQYFGEYTKHYAIWRDCSDTFGVVDIDMDIDIDIDEDADIDSEIDDAFFDITDSLKESPAKIIRKILIYRTRT
jgi:hypothetical protein